MKEYEVVSEIETLNDTDNFTVSRLIDDRHCVELHLDSGKCSIEVDEKVDDDTWNNITIINMENFSLDDISKEKDYFLLNKIWCQYFESSELTVKDLLDLCQQEILAGHGDRKILITSDVEGNGYHGLWYGFNEVEDNETVQDLFQDGNNPEEVILLG